MITSYVVFFFFFQFELKVVMNEGHTIVAESGLNKDRGQMRLQNYKSRPFFPSSNGIFSL